jgi:hypothetical protein
VVLASALVVAAVLVVAELLELVVLLLVALVAPTLLNQSVCWIPQEDPLPLTLLTMA